jgi:hypothetical protein
MFRFFKDNLLVILIFILFFTNVGLATLAYFLKDDKEHLQRQLDDCTTTEQLRESNINVLLGLDALNRSSSLSFMEEEQVIDSKREEADKAYEDALLKYRTAKSKLDSCETSLGGLRELSEILEGRLDNAPVTSSCGASTMTPKQMELLKHVCENELPFSQDVIDLVKRRFERM